MRRRGTDFKSETELAAEVVAWLRSDEWTVYQEVNLGAATADIVAVRSPLVWILETKLAFNMQVCDQAMKWRLSRCSNLVTVVTPSPKKPSLFLLTGLRQSGIGLVTVSGHVGNCVFTRDIKSEMVRVNPKCSIKDSLRPEMENFAQAGSRGGYWTPFKDTRNRLADIVRAQPGITLKDAITALKTHHYKSDASAITSCADNIARGIMGEVEIRVDGVTVQSKYGLPHKHSKGMRKLGLYIKGTP